MKRFLTILTLTAALSGFCFAQENVGSCEGFLSANGEYSQVLSTKIGEITNVHLGSVKFGDFDVRAWAGLNLSSDGELNSGFSLGKTFEVADNADAFVGFGWAAFAENEKPFSKIGVHAGVTWRF